MKKWVTGVMNFFTGVSAAQRQHTYSTRELRDTFFKYLSTHENEYVRSHAHEFALGHFVVQSTSEPKSEVPVWGLIEMQFSAYTLLYKKVDITGLINKEEDASSSSSNNNININSEESAAGTASNTNDNSGAASSSNSTSKKKKASKTMLGKQLIGTLELHLSISTSPESNAYTFVIRMKPTIQHEPVIELLRGSIEWTKDENKDDDSDSSDDDEGKDYSDPAQRYAASAPDPEEIVKGQKQRLQLLLKLAAFHSAAEELRARMGITNAISTNTFEDILLHAVACKEPLKRITEYIRALRELFHENNNSKNNNAQSSTSTSGGGGGDIEIEIHQQHE